MLTLNVVSTCLCQHVIVNMSLSTCHQHVVVKVSLSMCHCQLKDVEAELTQRDTVIKQLSDKLQVTVENRDLLQAEYVEQAAQLSSQVQLLQQQLKQVRRLSLQRRCDTPHDVTRLWTSGDL